MVDQNQAAAVIFDDVACDREAKTGAAITDADHDLAGFFAEADCGVTAVFDGIVEQVGQAAPQRSWLCGNR